jgi:hypothetical protein
LITAIAARLQAESGKITVFHRGLDANAPDVAARKVAAFENRAQRNLLYCPRQKLFKVIRQIETYDVILYEQVFLCILLQSYKNQD